MKIKNITLLFATIFVISTVSACSMEPNQTETHQVTYYMTNEGNWAGTTYEYIEEGTSAPDLSINDVSKGTLENFNKRYADVNWYQEDTHQTPFDFTQTINQDTKIYGLLEEKSFYTFDFYVDEQLFETIEIANGEQVRYPNPEPAAEPGTRLFWSTKKDDFDQYLNASNKAYIDTVLYAFFLSFK